MAEGHLRTGRPAREIIELSEEIGADLVVVGSTGLTGLERLVLGSVSEAVVRYASCPGLVMRQENDERLAALTLGRDLRGSGPSSCPYSPECVKDEFLRRSRRA